MQRGRSKKRSKARVNRKNQKLKSNQLLCNKKQRNMRMISYQLNKIMIMIKVKRLKAKKHKRKNPRNKKRLSNQRRN